MKQYSDSTLVPDKDNADGTMIAHPDSGTLLPTSQTGTMLELSSNLGTMVINSDSDETMKSKKLFQ